MLNKSRKEIVKFFDGYSLMSKAKIKAIKGTGLKI